MATSCNDISKTGRVRNSSVRTGDSIDELVDTLLLMLVRIMWDLFRRFSSKILSDLNFLSKKIFDYVRLDTFYD